MLVPSKWLISSRLRAANLSNLKGHPYARACPSVLCFRFLGSSWTPVFRPCIRDCGGHTSNIDEVEAALQSIIEVIARA